MISKIFYICSRYGFPYFFVLLVLLVIVALNSCIQSKKMAQLKANELNPQLSLFTEQGVKPYGKLEILQPDTSVVDEQLVLHAVMNDGQGEVMASGTLSPVVVSAKFKNLAERQGKVQIAFDVCVPESLQDREWQVRIAPKLKWGRDSLLLDKIFVTGKDYLNSQERGYAKYRKYLSGIIPDSVDFVKAFGYLGLLKHFTHRNIENNEFGASYEEAIAYYIKHWLVKSNARKKAKLAEVFRKCVKQPYIKDGVRLDTIIMQPNGDLHYMYLQDVAVKRDMKSLNLSFDGGVYSWGEQIYNFPESEPLTYYISSITQFADYRPLYLLEREKKNIVLKTMAFIEFEVGKWDVRENLSSNIDEIARIKANLDSLKTNTIFAADSVIITASCSPEGSYAFNTELAKKRGEAITDYFAKYFEASSLGVKFLYDYVPENWELLKEYILADGRVIEKEQVLKVWEIEDVDEREEALSKCKDYRYIRQSLYPLLRKTDFKFTLHRKRATDVMVQTSDIDAEYLKGLEALRERDFKKAIELLRPYSNINTAIAYMCLDYNNSALNILQTLEQTANVKYMTALLYARMGNAKAAADYYLSSIKDEPKLRFRAALDPEMNNLFTNFYN